MDWKSSGLWLVILAAIVSAALLGDHFGRKTATTLEAIQSLRLQQDQNRALTSEEVAGARLRQKEVVRIRTITRETAGDGGCHPQYIGHWLGRVYGPENPAVPSGAAGANKAVTKATNKPAG